MLSGADLEVLAGARIVIHDSAEISMGEAEDLTVANSPGEFRSTMIPAYNELSGGAPVWQPSGTGTTFCEGYLQTATGGWSIAFPITICPGDSITSLNVVVRGQTSAGHSALPTGSDRLTVRLIAVSTFGISATIAQRADQSASTAAYNSTHSIPVDSLNIDSGVGLPHVVNDGSAYYVVIKGESGANALANETAVLSVAGDCVARSYRNVMVHC
jgi:hypothetical protein